MVDWVYNATGANFEAAAAIGQTPQPNTAIGPIVVRTTVGQSAKPGENPEVTLNVLGMYPRTYIHGHPDGRYASGQLMYQQRPTTPADGVESPDTTHGMGLYANLVVGKGDGRVYFYNSAGTYARVPIEKITNLKR
jgi:hypothetical protein